MSPLLVPILVGILGQLVLAFMLDFRTYAPMFLLCDALAVGAYVIAIAIL